MKIGNFDIDDKVLVVAEIGNNHEGNFSLAQEMIGQAALAGAGAVKFQTIVPEDLVSVGEKDRIAQLRKFSFTPSEFEQLSQTAEAEGVLFLTTPFSLGSVGYLSPIVSAFKIASCDLTFFPLIESVACTGKPMLVSTGVAEMEEIRQACQVIEAARVKSGWKVEFVLLHCVSCYPTLPERANLRSISALKDLGYPVGYSDHTLGIDAAVLSVALGARIIEKHFTIDKNYSAFRDHQLSADPADLARLVTRVAEAEQMLGDHEARCLDCERENRSTIRRSIAACRPLLKGTVLEMAHLTWVRPGDGLSPGQEGMVIGRRLNQDVSQGDKITPQMLV